MKRILLPNESEGSWQFDPSSTEQVIEARLRRHESIEKAMREASQAEPQRFKRGALGLSEAEITSIRWECLQGFLESAKLPDELRERRAYYRESYERRVEQLPRMPEALRDAELARAADFCAAAFARECQIAIARATGHFADMLTQAVIARRGRKDFSLTLRVELWAECLGFAMSLNPTLASQWADRAWGHDPRESVMPHVVRLDTIAEQAKETEKFLLPFIQKFQAGLRHSSPAWLDEADRRIVLRCLLSLAPGGRDRLKDKSKRALALALTANPGQTTKQVCGMLDAHNERRPNNAPIPSAWKRKGTQLWADAYQRFPSLVHAYVSKVRKQIGKTASS